MRSFKQLTAAIAACLFVFHFSSKVFADTTDVVEDESLTLTEVADTEDVVDPQSVDATADAQQGDIDIILVGSDIVDEAAVGTATATGVNALGGDDTVTISNTVDASAAATARAGDVSIGTVGVVAVSSAWNGGAIATSTSTGVSGGDGSDTINNISTVTSTADSTSNAGQYSTPAVLAVTVVTASATTNSTGIAGGEGGNSVFNSGELSSSSTATANAASVDIVPIGVAANTDFTWEGGTTAIAESTGISTGAGVDIIDSTNVLSSRAVASTSSTAVSATIAGVAIAEVAASARAESVGIDSGGGDDVITVGGFLDSSTQANAYGNQVAIAVMGVAAAPDSHWNDGTTSTSIADGIQAGAGDDSITLIDTGVMTTTSFATTETAAASITLEKKGGVAANLAHALTDVQSLADASATGIDAGDGDNTVANNGENIVVADALVLSTEISLTLKGKRNAIIEKVIGWLVDKGGSTSTATANGVVTGNGVDTITNTGVISADATSMIPSLGVGLTLAGGPSVSMKSVVSSSATGISSGDGNDVVTNGIIQDPALPPVIDDSQISATASSTAISAGVGVTGFGGAAVSGSLESNSISAGIRTGSGDDTVTNASTITSDASATSFLINVGVNLGQAPDSGDGDDKPKKQKVKLSATSSATASAVGVDTEGDKTSTFVDLGIDGDVSSTSINFRYTEAVEADTDRVLNDGSITVSADSSATTQQAAVNVGKKGAAATKSKVSAASDAVAIITGGGDDIIESNGSIDVDATSYTETDNVAVFLGTGRAVAKSGGSGASSTATGIAADSENRSFMIESIMSGGDDGSSITLTHTRAAASGDDTITNTGDMDVFASAEAYAADAAVTSKNISATLTDSSSSARSYGIVAGDGADTVTNDGTLVTRSEAITGVVGASVVADVGLAVAASLGNSATAESTGIDGDSDFSSLSYSAEISASSNIDILDGTVPDVSNLISTSKLEVRSEELSFGGDDTITNNGDLTASTLAVNLTGELGLVVTKGAAAVMANSEAVATTTGISGGAGNDTIDNFAFIDTDAVANADSLGVSVTVAGIATAANKLLDGGSIAKSSSVGIEGDGTSNEGRSLTLESEVDTAAGTYSSSLTASTWTTSDDGDDVITNNGVINSTSVAVAPAISVAVSMRGVSGAISTATAEAETAGIRAGGGGDTVDNFGEIIVGAVAQADAVNVTIAPAGVGIAANSVHDGGVVGSSRAIGIDTDGGFSSQATDRVMAADTTGVSVSTTTTSIKTSGDDVLTNDALVRARATSVVPSIAVAYSGSGVGVAISTAESNAYASALDTGGGDDHITNSEGVSAVATSNADTINVGYTNAGVALAADAVWSGGATSNADAIGINSDGEYASRTQSTSIDTTYAIDGSTVTHSTSETMEAGDDTIINDGDVTAEATAVSPSIGVSIVPGGVSLVATAATSNANAVAIDAGAGADDITNTAELEAVARSNADVVSVSYATGLAVAGNAVWDGGVTANSNASGIKAHGILSSTRTLTLSTVDGNDLVSVTDEVVDDDADDIVTNSGVINATSNALTIDLNGAIAPFGVAVGVSTATANSSAFGIETGAGSDTVTNTNSINAWSSADAVAINITGTGGGVALSGDAVWDGGTTANATSDAISTRGGDDTITNSGYLNVNSLAVAGSATGNLAIYGVAGGSATSTAISNGTGINSGAGVDVITNNNTIDVESVANADSLAVNLNWFGLSASAPDAWDGGTRSIAFAQGIDAGADNDTVTNNSLIDVRGTSVSVIASVPVSVGGVTAAISTSSAGADVEGIDGGEGDDTIINNNSILAYADSTAVAVTASVPVFGVALAADATWDGGTNASARSDGISGDVGNDTITNTSLVDADARARASSNQISLTLIGVALSNSTSDTFARSSALDGGEGNDTITNSADITSDSIAHSTSVGVDIAGLGAAGSFDSEWDGGTSSDADAFGISGGAGDDVLTNSARIDVNAESDADSVGIAATAAAISVATASSTAKSTATGIAGGDGVNTITNNGGLTANSDADAQALAIGVTLTGGSGSDPFLDNVTSSAAHANGITGGVDVDTITTLELSSINVTANALARDNNITGTYMIGFSAASANSRAESFATGIGGGAGDDIIDLQGTIVASATSEANSRSISFNTAGANILKADTLAEATATGVAGGDGNDTVTNAATINAISDASNLGRTVGIVELGATFGMAASTADAKAYGVDLGDGINSLVSSGDISATATSDVIARDFGLALAGFSRTDANTDADSTSVGVRGGTGADTVTVLDTASVTATSTSNSDANGVSFNLVGAGISDNVITSDSRAWGMALNSGIDTISNNGSIAANATANGTMTGGFTFNIAGAGIRSGLATTSSTAVAVATGEDDDVVTNNAGATITASATSTSTTTGSQSITVAGYSDNDLTANVIARSFGLAVGDGNDTVINDGLIDVESRTNSTVAAGNVTVAGDGGAVAGSDATTEATGIAGGDGEDDITNNGEIEVGVTDAQNSAGDWMAYLDIGSSSFTFAGVTGSSATATALTESMGIDGGAADDQIRNFGTLSVFANSLSESSGSSIDIFGTAGSTESAGADSLGIGMAGGTGADVIENSGSLLVSAHTKLVLDGSSYVLGGVGETSGTLTANTDVFGIVGDAGDDVLLNSGSLIARGFSEMSSTGNSNTTFGGSSTAANSGATANVTGLFGGAGNDTIVSTGPAAVIDIEAIVDVATGSSSYSFVGSPSSGAVITGNATAAGARGGDGADSIDTDGTVTVTAKATLLTTGAARSSIGGGADTIGEATTSTIATGFAGEVGDDTIRSASSLSVLSDSQAGSHNTSNSGADILSSSRAEAKSRANSTAFGFTGGDGVNDLSNNGDAFVSARSSANAIAYANGATVSITGTATAITNSVARATATGMAANDGDNTVTNTASMVVSADAGTTQAIQTTVEVLSIDANANPDTVEPTDAPDYIDAALPAIPDGAYAEGDVLFWNIVQDENGDGPIDDPLIGPVGAHYVVVRTETTASDGTVTVTWDWQPVLVTAYQREYFAEGHETDAVSRGKGANGNGLSRSTGTTVAVAKGIELGDGNNVVRNDGELTVTADANTEVTANASGSTTGDATAQATATATAEASGIILGEGNNVVTNSGDISVTAIATTTATAIAAPGDGFCIQLLFWEVCVAPGSSSETATATRNVAATGITTGSGNNAITNDGNIIVVARANSPGSASVIGIQTGSGADTITNNGLISATFENLAGSVTGVGIGIDTGAGNDTVRLGDGSSVIGSVSLGADDDTLWLFGDATVTNHLGDVLNPDGGVGNDHLILSGSGGFFGVPANFERATKRDAGVFWLDALLPVSALTIDGGTLELGTSYTFAPASTFDTFIHSDGSFGELLVNGVATLDGSIMVERRGDDYINDGTRYAVINSMDPLVGDFGSITLPDALPLLSFGFERGANTVEVVANAASFQTVADSSLQFSVAGVLDQLAAGSSGEFRQQFGTLQSMESGFSTALDSLSPDAHLALTTNTIAIAHQTTQMLRTHLTNARAVLRGTRDDAAAYNPVAIYYDGTQLVSTDPSQTATYPGSATPSAKRVAGNSRAETWIMGFGGSGNIDLVDGYTDYNQDMSGFVIGADYLFASNVIAGFSLGKADSDLTMRKAAAQTDIDSWNGSLYATAFWDSTYLEGGMYFGRQEFVSQREININEVVSDVVSEHDGRSTMAFVGAGKSFELSGWTLEPYGTLYYFDLSEDGFSEAGAGSLNQIVKKKSSNALLGEIGATFSSLRAVGTGYLDWHTTLAYNHDFDIDSSSISYAFEGAPMSFSNIYDRNLLGNSAVFGTGLSYQRGRSILSLDYRGQFNGDYEHHILGARAVYVFN